MSYRTKQIVSLMGSFTFSRPYYHCSTCSHGHFPWDGTLRLTEQRLSPAAREVVSLAGVHESFGKAADRSLEKMAGLRLSESTVQRTTEAAGRQAGERLEQGAVFGDAPSWDWHRDANGKTCAYVSVDWTGIMMQGDDGGKVDGRMVAVGMVFNPQPRTLDDESVSKPCDGVRYLAGFYTLDELGAQLRRQAGQVGMNRAEQWIALTDGGNGLEPFVDVNFPRAEKILDFRHAAEHVSDFAKKYRPGKGAAPLANAWCHTLKHAGGKQLVRVLGRLKRDKMTPEAQEEYDSLLHYLGNNESRTDYPRYLKNGWNIASGAIESACKRVINQRLCMGGMRWGEPGSDAVAHLRALYLSDEDQWNAFWAIAT